MAKREYQPFPRMLYRKGKIQGAKALWNNPDVYYAIAADEGEQSAMMSEAGFVRSIAEAQEEPKQNTQRSDLVIEAESLGIKVGRKGADRLKAEIATKKAENGNADHDD